MLEEIFNTCEEKMNSSIEHMQKEFKTLRTGKLLQMYLTMLKLTIMELQHHLIKLVQ